LQQQFTDDILSMGLLLYVSRAWLSHVFHQVIAQDLFASIDAADTQVLTTLLSGNLLPFIACILQFSGYTEVCGPVWAENTLGGLRQVFI